MFIALSSGVLGQVVGYGAKTTQNVLNVTSSNKALSSVALSQYLRYYDIHTPGSITIPFTLGCFV
ncbi:hypothetical protein BDZ94DRAFT_1254348 [Collybia nuda]|uniref:Uncharacterized protein n=1 Tax=Collybia nuda TaxID=64659 RepID=A0A9P6CM47_9AGAR|nr:hypothetical protein BDZ94DRAFT_1254348 [Collybia nuda]